MASPYGGGGTDIVWCAWKHGIQAWLFKSHGILSCSHLIPQKWHHKTGGLFSEGLLTKIVQTMIQASSCSWLISDSCPVFFMPRQGALYSWSYQLNIHTAHTWMMEFSWTNLHAPARGQGVTFHVRAYPGREFLCLSPPSPPLCSLLWGRFASHQKGKREAREIELSLRPTDFTGWFTVSLFYLACLGAVWGHMRFFSWEAFSRPDFPLEWHIILPSNVAIVNSCLGSSNCLELHTIWISQYGINKALLFCNPLLKLVKVISGDITFPCLAFDYARNSFPSFNRSFLVVCNRNLFKFPTWHSGTESD